jgi:Cys-tRNA synthase (O-phospho-L-seryl-tRNA:Cys-tRNA synthase)
MKEDQCNESCDWMCTFDDGSSYCDICVYATKITPTPVQDFYALLDEWVAWPIYF